jgi:hypothetical protein
MQYQVQYGTIQADVISRTFAQEYVSFFVCHIIEHIILIHPKPVPTVVSTTLWNLDNNTDFIISPITTSLINSKLADIRSLSESYIRSPVAISHTNYHTKWLPLLQWWSATSLDAHSCRCPVSTTQVLVLLVSSVPNSQNVSETSLCPFPFLSK